MTAKERILAIVKERGEFMTSDLYGQYAKKTIRQEVEELRLEKKIYRARWVPVGSCNRQTPVYQLGSLPDVPMPVMTEAESRARRQMLARQKYASRNQRLREKRAKAREQAVLIVTPELEKIKRALKAGKELSVDSMSSIAGIDETHVRIILKQLKNNVYISDYIRGKPHYSWKWNNEKNVEKPKNVTIPLSEIVSTWSFLYGAARA